MTAKKLNEHQEETCGVRLVHLDRVRQARLDEPAPRQMEAAARIMKALGDSTRLRLVTALRGGEMCVCDLAAFLNVSESAVSHQLRRLKDLSLVKSRRDGQILYYSLDDQHVAGLVAYLLDHVNH